MLACLLATDSSSSPIGSCCGVCLFLKSSAVWASTGAYTASTNVSDTAEPAHQGERQDAEEYEQEEEQNEQEEDEEVDMDNKWQ